MACESHVRACPLRIRGSPALHVVVPGFRISRVSCATARSVLRAVRLQVADIGFVLTGAYLGAVLLGVGLIARVDQIAVSFDIRALLLEMALVVRQPMRSRPLPCAFEVLRKSDGVALQSLAPAPSRGRGGRPLGIARLPRIVTAPLCLSDPMAFAAQRETDWVRLQLLGLRARRSSSFRSRNGSSSRVCFETFAISPRSLTVIRTLSFASGLVHSPSDTKCARSCQWDLRRSARRAAASSMSGSAFRIASASGIPSGVLTSIAATPCDSSTS